MCDIGARAKQTTEEDSSRGVRKVCRIICERERSEGDLEDRQVGCWVLRRRVRLAFIHERGFVR